MKCPNCRTDDDLRVLDSRHIYNGIRRRRECKWCGYRFNTIERYVPDKEKDE